MNLDNPIRMVRELKGAPLSILFALSLVKVRVSGAWLERTTGYTDKTIAQAIGYLEEIGLADHTSAGWQLTGAAKQLPLPLQLEDEVADAENAENTENIADDNSDDSGHHRRISDPFIIITDIDSNKDDLYNNNNKGGRKNSDSAQNPVFQALTQAGIRGKKRESLSQCATLTVESVENWEMQLKREKGRDYSPGLLITVLEGGAPAPVNREKKDYRSYLIEHGLMCATCGNNIQDCECEEDG